MLRLVTPYLTTGKRFTVAGPFRESIRDKALYVENGCDTPKIDDRLTCNSEEGDMRVWIHCKYSIGSKKLVFSPDTDTYHVGMGLLEDARMSDYDIYVKLSRLGEAEKFLHLSVLNEALQSDQNLAVVPPSVKVKALQMLYITTGCDYVSFFYNVGKARLLQCFFQHAPFITSGSTYI